MEAPACNRAIVLGEMVTEPETRILPGGTELLSFSLTVRRAGTQTTSVPLVWYDPPKRTQRWQVGARVVATGSVVRRFYRAGGATGSRTEITVEQADVVTKRSRGRRVIDRARADLAALVAELESQD